MPYMLVVALAVLGALTATTDPLPAAVRSQGAASVESRVDALFTREIRADGPGCAVGVYKDGQAVVARGYGVANVEDGRRITPSTMFNLGSLSKPFTTLAVLILEQRGQLSMDDDVRRWVPELPNYGTPIRVRDLLQHTSGLRDFGSLEVFSGRPISTMAEFVSLVAAQRGLNFTPGTQHEYSHSDYGVLGLIVERVVGAPFGEHLRRAVLEPMGMKRSFVDVRSRSITDRAFGHAVSPQGANVRFPVSQTFGGENLYSSVEDLAYWDRNFEKPIVGGPKVISRMLGRPALPSGESIPYAYGLRLGTYRGLPTVSRGGHAPGTRTEVIRFPDQRLTVSTLCNGDHLEAWRFAQGVADLYLGDLMTPARPRPEPPSAVAVPPEELTRYAGIYRPVDQPWNLLPIEVRNGVLGEVLFDDSSDVTFYPMRPAGGGRFVEIGLTGNVGIFAFHPATAGAPPRLDISWNDEPSDVLERVPNSEVWRPSGSALAEYAGTWFSQDLDASWQLQVREDRLLLRRRGQSDLTLRPIERDQFVRGFGPDSELTARLQFHRDAASTLTHLTVSTPPGDDPVQDLRFIRLVTGLDARSDLGVMTQQSGDEKMIRDARASSNAAIAAHDLVGIARVWMEDVHVVSSTSAQTAGRELNRQRMARQFENRSDTIYIRRPTAIDVNPSWAMASERGEWTGRWTEPDGALEIGGHYLVQWRKVDGQWLIQAELYVPTRCNGSRYCSQRP